MDEARISITVRPIYLERLLYWIIIVVLAVLLILAWMKDGTECDTTKTTTDSGKLSGDTQQTAPTQPTQPTQPAVQEPVKPAETCSDGIKNQDETDTDCGGKCTKCGSGKACKVAGDCIGGYCVSNACTSTAPVVLSNKVEFDVTNVQTKSSPSDTVKVVGISYKITNGLAEASDGYVVKVFVKNRAGTRCLNQRSSGTCDDSYAEFQVAKLASGKSITATKTFEPSEYTTMMGQYLLEDNGYTPGDSTDEKFQVIAYLYDDAGNQIDGKTIADSYSVSP